MYKTWRCFGKYMYRIYTVLGTPNYLLFVFNEIIHNNPRLVLILIIVMHDFTSQVLIKMIDFGSQWLFNNQLWGPIQYAFDWHKRTIKRARTLCVSPRATNQQGQNNFGPTFKRNQPFSLCYWKRAITIDLTKVYASHLRQYIDLKKPKTEVVSLYIF